MKHRLYHARELPASLEAAWPLFDFPSAGWTLTGGGEREVGTRREIEIPGLGRIVDELTAYERSEHHVGFSYRLVNDDNPMRAVGYQGTARMYRNSTDPGRCFMVYTSFWDEMSPEMAAALPGMITTQFDEIFKGLQAE
ncbi:MAG: SRPBCC family protein [Myxococcales bacterium]|nr:SRPBCC family protein [Myxococcales bacterium]